MSNDQKLDRVERAARELESAMRDCDGMTFEVRYGSVWRHCEGTQNLKELVSDALSITVTRVLPATDIWGRP